jgi:hypothetical protein
MKGARTDRGALGDENECDRERGDHEMGRKVESTAERSTFIELKRLGSKLSRSTSPREAFSISSALELVAKRLTPSGQMRRRATKGKTRKTREVGSQTSQSIRTSDVQGWKRL